MASLNKVMLIGNLGKDPEIRYTPSGSAVANFSMATVEKYKKDGEWKESTEWHNVVVWGKLAEICGEYLAKGKPVYIEGRLQTRKWQDKDGKDRYTTEIVGEKMQMLGGRDAGQGGGGGSASQHQESTFNPDDEIPFIRLPSIWDAV